MCVWNRRSARCHSVNVKTGPQRLCSVELQDLAIGLSVCLQRGKISGVNVHNAAVGTGNRFHDIPGTLEYLPIDNTKAAVAQTAAFLFHRLKAYNPLAR